jgi:hypothetical protein
VTVASGSPVTCATIPARVATAALGAGSVMVTVGAAPGCGIAWSAR